MQSPAPLVHGRIDHLLEYAVVVGLLGCAQPTADDKAPEPCDHCELTADDNFSYQAELWADVVEVGAQADLVVDWSGVDRDLQGHPIDPLTDVDRAVLVMFPGREPADMEDTASEGLPDVDPSCTVDDERFTSLVAEPTAVGTVVRVRWTTDEPSTGSRGRRPDRPVSRPSDRSNRACDRSSGPLRRG